MKVERKLTKTRIQLLLDQPFFGNLAMNMNLKEDKNLPYKSLAVDEKGNLYYDPEFVEKLSIEELKFVFCHEVLHLVFNHITRKGTREVQKWYKACDYAVNSVVVDARIGSMPGGDHKGLHDHKYDGWSADRIYADLPDEKDGKCGCRQGSGQGPPCPNCGGGSGDPRGNVNPGQGFDDHIQSGGKGMTDQQKKDTEDGWKRAVARAATGARFQGKVPAGLEQLIEELLNPKVDWRTVLWQFVQRIAKDDYRWYPTNRRYVHQGLYLPSMRSETFSVAVAIDTSGSISDDELTQFLSEVQAILEMHPTCTLHFYECDAEIGRYEELHAGDRVSGEVVGRGGTDFRPVFEHVKDKQIDIDCLAYLTDGYGSYPDQPEYPVLWIMTDDYKPPWGETIKLED